MLNQGVSRRNFLRASGAAAVVSFSALGAGAQISPDDDDDSSTTGKLVKTFRFREGTAGMLPCYTDYGLDTTGFDFLAEVRPLPAEVSVRGDRSSFYIQGNNHSDDLFMFLKTALTRKDGIMPGQAYLLSFVISLASRSNNCFGVGGSEDAVWLKAGGSKVEPVPLLEAGGYVSINIDKGDQSQGGKNLGSIGSIFNGKECPIQEWVLLRKTYDHPYPIHASTGGELWIATGVESGYESLTGVYFHTIRVALTPVNVD